MSPAYLSRWNAKRQCIRTARLQRADFGGNVRYPGGRPHICQQRRAIACLYMANSGWPQGVASVGATPCGRPQASKPEARGVSAQPIARHHKLPKPIGQIHHAYTIFERNEIPVHRQYQFTVVVRYGHQWFEFALSRFF